MDAVSLIELGMRLYTEAKLDELREHVHADAEIQMVLLHGEIARGPDGLSEALQSAQKSLHLPYGTRIEPIDDSAAIMVGRVRYPLRGGGFGDRAAAWLNVLKDGKIWRVRVYADADEARLAYETEFAPELHAPA